MLSTTGSDNLPTDSPVDTTPFLGNALYNMSLAQGTGTSNPIMPTRVQSVRTHGQRQATRFLRRASNSRRMMMEPSMMVREKAAHCDETPVLPLWLWVVGYALQCVVHVLCISLEYRWRRQSLRGNFEVNGGGEGKGESEPIWRRRNEEEASYGY
ncbi:hypothetical protein Ancab_014822 [Ancistrocladus abbreviatus]